MPTTQQQKQAIESAAQGQTRGMKVGSAVKKRCEHCKVRFILVHNFSSCRFPSGTDGSGSRAPKTGTMTARLTERM